MRYFKKLILATVMLSLVASFSACEKGPAEKAGEKGDKAAEKTKEEVKDATH